MSVQREEVEVTVSGNEVLDPVIVKAIKNGKKAKISEWLAGLPTPGHVNTVADARELKYATGDSEVSSKGMTALHYAAFYSKVDIVGMLLKAGAVPTIVNDANENALHIGVQGEGEDTEIVQVADLLLKDRDDYVDALTEEEGGWTALLMAIYLNLPLTVDKLLKHGADPSIDVGAGGYQYSVAMAAMHEGDILQKILNTGKCNVNWNEGKYTALHLAVKFFQLKNVNLLIKKGADMLARDAFGLCPIHYAVGATSYADFISVVSVLKRSINEQDDIEMQTVLHLAVIQNKPEFVRILRHKFNAGFSRKDAYGRLPIHYLSNQADVQDLVDLLGEGDSIINCLDKKGLTPLHLAVKQNDPEFAKVLLRNGADPDITATKQKRWLIHLATIANTTDNDFQAMVDMLKANIEDFNVSQPDANGRTALHWALDTRKFSKAIILLKVYNADPSLTDCNQKNCLHIAFHRNSPGEVVKLILKGHRDLQKAKDKDGNTPLQYLSSKTPLAAIKALDPLDEHLAREEAVQRVEVVLECGKQKRTLHVPHVMQAETLLERAKLRFDRTDIVLERFDKESQGWAELTGGEVYLDTGEKLNVRVIAEKEPPLNQAIELRRLDMVKLLLVKGAELDVDTLKEAIIKEDKELAYILVRHARHIKTPLNMEIATPSYTGDHDEEQELELKNTSEGMSSPTKKTTTLFRELVIRMPEVAKEALERCVTIVKNEEEEEEATFDYSYIHWSKEENSTQKGSCSESLKCLPHCNEPDHSAMANPLELMVLNKRIELMQHPVVWRYLFMKWNSLGFWFYFIKLFVYAIFLICLSLFVLSVNDPLSPYCQSSNQSNETTDMSEDLLSSAFNRTCGVASRRIFSYVMAFVVILLALYHLLVEFLRLTYSVWAYLKDIRNYVEVLLYTSCIVFVFNFATTCGCVLDWQWQVGIFVIFLGWINLIFFASKFPLTGIYVLVFKEILITFLKLLVFAILLVIAFTLILYMMFSDPQATISSFSNIGHSFVKTTTMVTGELGFEDLFDLGDSPSDYNPIPYFVSSFIMWLIFLVLVPIVLNNMLVSLAVGDAKEVIENAELKKLILQVKTVVLAEEVVPKSLRRFALGHIKSEMKVKLTKEKGLRRLLNALQLFIFGGINYTEGLEDSTYHERRKDERAEIRGQSAEDDGVRQTQEEILRRLDQLYDLVMTSEENIKRCQKNDQQLMRIVGKLH